MIPISTNRLIICCLLVLLARTATAYEPTEHYETRKLEGWTLRINKDLLQDAALSDKVLRLLEFQLYQIKRVVPALAVGRLQEVSIWIELNDPKFPGMCYHPSADWLKEHDLNPEKAGGVELANATNFLSWSKEQPWMVLHEMAHSYHHRVLGYDNPEIKAAFTDAVASKKYENVLRINGKMEKHYALNNDQEYFAEATEAYFGVNDFYPYVRSELKQHDSKIYELLGKLWGNDASDVPTRTVAEKEKVSSISSGKPSNSAQTNSVP
jgi:hypothetical protein